MHYWKLGAALALSLGLAACNTTVTPNLTPAYIEPQNCPVEDPCEGPPPPSEPEVILSPNTRILDSAVQSYDPATGRLVLTSTGVTAAYAVGHIVVGDVTPNTPAGVPPRRITSVTNSGGTVVLSTQEAGLTDAVQDGEVNFTRTLTVNDIAEETTSGMVATALNGQSLLSALAVSCTTSGTIYSANFTKSIGSAVVLNGCARVGLDTTLNLRINHFKLQSFEASLKMSEEAQLELALKPFADDAEWELGRIRFKPITVSLGPVPIVMTPYVVFVAGVNGTVSANVSYKVIQNASYTTGLKYTNGTLNKINLRTSFFQAPDPIHDNPLTGNAKGYLDIKPGLNFYSTVALATAQGDVIGTVRGYIKADFDTSRNPVWQITAGPQFCISYKTKLNALFGLVDETWSGNECSNELRAFERNSSTGTGIQNPSPYQSWNNVSLVFTNTYGDIEIYKTDPGMQETMVIRLAGNNTFDLTPFVHATKTTEFRIKSISKKPGTFSSYQRKIDMSLFGNGDLVWDAPAINCTSCSSADVYRFKVNKSIAFFQIQ
ncbi:hypothetical protein [Deinococcus aerophilus]|uniref:Uncharacterized protein n=1 Tax=Deinococcus aerophilus TaxID=522488 RepID=A0ABQ2GX99_9DEIO|nr:hypothetical protein [Deinococcus aerophilus]GGM18342.1 hypothetical protein GCM10010841_28050 [Deinococcus aerophilus]